MQESKQPDDESPGEPGTHSKWSRNVQLPGLDTLAGLESTRYLGKWLLIGSIIGIWWPAEVFQAAENLSKLLNAVPESLWWLFGAGYLGYTGARSFDKWRGVPK